MRGPTDEDVVYLELDGTRTAWTMHREGGHGMSPGQAFSSISRQYVPARLFDRSQVGWCERCWPITVPADMPAWLATETRSVHRWPGHSSPGPACPFTTATGVGMDRYDALNPATTTLCDNGCWT